MSTKELEIKITRIIRDNSSGSIALYNTLFAAYKKYAIQTKASVIAHERIKRQLEEIITERHDLQVLHHFSDFLLTKMENRKMTGTDMAVALENYHSQWHTASFEAAKNAYQMLDPSYTHFMVISNSQTVIEFFQNFPEHAENVYIYQLESRPVMEGRLQAQKLSAMGFQVSIIPDAAMYAFLPEADLVITGADCITHTHVKNKIGTFPLAAGCKLFQIPFWVIADSRKISPHRKGVKKEKSYPSVEVWEDAPEEITPVNVYFEWVPKEYMTSFITEKGKIED